MSLEVLGLDHLYLSVSDFERSERFYDPVMKALGFYKGDRQIGGECHAHYFNRSLQYTIRPARSRGSHDAYAPGAVHHVCFQVPDRAAVDEAEAKLRTLRVEVSAAAEYPEYNDDYYAIFFSDPDGTRLEIVARSRGREEIVARWGELDEFVNPLAKLAEREKKGA